MNLRFVPYNQFSKCAEKPSSALFDRKMYQFVNSQVGHTKLRHQQ
uniref:Uncharacterized protein n=1 Tax=Anguilla anguilla TaxID=7936 RepID=A0A0E9XIL0_ANGAN